MGRSYEDIIEKIKLEVEKAASDGNPISLLELLSVENVLDGLVRRLQGRWRTIDSDDLLDIICFSVDELFYKVREGKLINNPMGYLWTTADFKVHEHYRKIKKTINFGELEDTIKDTSVIRDFDRDKLDELDEQEKKRVEAIKIARSLLHKIRSENIQNVLAYIFDAIEKGFEQIDNQDIADAFGLTLRTVRDCRSRGFQRLSRLAVEEKIIHEPFDFLQPDNDREEDKDSLDE